MAFEDRIIQTVIELQIDSDIVRIYPHDIASCNKLGVSCSVRTVRRYMARMAADGRLIRCGPRLGYLAC